MKDETEICRQVKSGDILPGSLFERSARERVSKLELNRLIDCINIF